MVAEADAKCKGRTRLSGKEERFCSLIAQGATQAAAYRLAYGVAPQRSATLWELGSRLAARPAVAARLKSIRTEAHTEDAMVMRQRRFQLAQTALDPRDSGAPSHAERIAAIREDAHLAGERRNDGSQLTLAGDVNLTLVIQSLRSGDLPLATQPAMDLPVVGSGGTAPSEPHKLAPAGSIPAPAPIFPAILGPLGRVKRAASVVVATESAAPFLSDE